MPITTDRFGFYKVDPTTDGDMTFNIKTMINDNLDAMESKGAKLTDIPTVPNSLPANGGNSTTVNDHTAAATPSTTEKVDLVGMVNEVKGNLDTHSADTTTYSTVKPPASLDINGIYTEVDLKRKNGTLIMKSVLSGGTSPNYTTRTETYYGADGTTITNTVVYTRSYDTNGNLSGEVMN